MTPLQRLRTTLVALALTAAALLTATTPAVPDNATSTVPAASAVRPGPHDDGPHPPLITRSQATTVRPHAVHQAPAVEALPGGGYQITDLDLHDGTLRHLPDGRYAMYGTMYACGYAWYVAPTPWCGFGVSTAPSLAGPWSQPVLLFSPSDTDPWSGLTWAHECGDTGQGCFNPRMIQRTGWGSDDGVWILWFNSPVDYSRLHANAFNALGCNSPTGPCGPGAGAPHGSYSKPSLTICAGNGDFSIIPSATLGASPAIVCTMPGSASLAIEQLNQWGVGGTGAGQHDVAALTNVEGPGGWYDGASGRYVLTYSDPACGYCAGTGTGYATTTDLYSGWTAPTNTGFSPPANGRRLATGTSCGGQPRTVTSIDGQPWQVIDLWNGSRTETAAATLITPLAYAPHPGTAGDRWTPEVTYPC